MDYLARVTVMPKPVVNDPQGLTVRHGLHALGFQEVEGVRVGKMIEVRLSGDSREAVQARVGEMCERLLANRVIEDYGVELVSEREGAAAP